MAFKIDTQMQRQIYVAKPQQPKPQEEIKPDSSPKLPNNNAGKIYARPSHPSQNLIDKYKTPGAFINTQNNIGNKLGIQNIITPKEEQQDAGKDALLGYLQSQNSAFQNLEDLSKMKLELQNSQELEAQIKEQLQQDSSDSFLSQLLARIQNPSF